MASYTATDVVTRALKRLAVLSAVETASAEDSVNGLDALNLMLHGLNAEGVAYAHVDIAATDKVNVGDHLVWAVIDRLAERLAPEYGIVPTPIMQSEFNRARRALAAGLFTIATATADRALRGTRAGSYNIDTDA